MTQEPTYEDVDPETGDISTSVKLAILLKSLEPKTPLQVSLLAVSKASRFSSTNERRRWKKLEDKAAGADPDSRVFKAWLIHCIAWATKKNRPVIYMPFTSAIGLAENEQKRENWIIKNRENVLKKKTPDEAKQVLENKLDELYNEEE